MEDLCNRIRAPQWIDLAQNSPTQIHDFFEREHMMHENKKEPCNSTFENVEDAQPASQVEVSCINVNAQADLEIMKGTPVKVISLKYRNNKEPIIEETTYDQLFGIAMRTLEHCSKLNKTTQEPKVFKTPNMSKLTKSSRSVGCILNKNNQSSDQDSATSAKVNKISSNCTSVNAKKKLVKQSLFKQNKDCAENDNFKRPKNPVDDSKDKEDKQCNEEDNEERKEEDNNEEHNEEADKSQDGQIESTDDNKNNEARNNRVDDVEAKGDRTQPVKHVAVLTWQNHRRSMYKRRTSVNKQYIGLAEAVSRFQNETPKRFRTRSNRNNAINPPFYASNLMQNRLKPTIPISPALVSKNRTRPVTVLSQEEREKLEMEEMKKFRIKANPIPTNVLRGPRTKVNARKPIVANTATQPDEKINSLFQSKSPHRDKAPLSLNTIPKVLVTDSEGITVEREENAFFGVPKNTSVAKSVTRVVPFSFEARNKDMQMKKEQRLKNLQEASKIKAEFHARPAPNFSKPSTSSFTKPPTPPVKQQQNAKRLLLPSPFSFEERNKKLSMKKEQLVKQVLEEDKRSRVFRANPAPVFKPVMVRGRSKDNLSLKNKSAKTGSEHNAEYKCEDQENKEPNEIDSYKAEGENTQRMSKSSACNVDKQKLPLKALPLELNTDKRAKERQNFDEKLKRKELEEEMKRQEEDRKRLEHERQLKAELRKLAEVKARPMPKYKPPIIAKSMKQLTDPQSPAFASKLRSKQK